MEAGARPTMTPTPGALGEGPAGPVRGRDDVLCRSECAPTGDAPLPVASCVGDHRAVGAPRTVLPVGWWRGWRSAMDCDESVRRLPGDSEQIGVDDLDGPFTDAVENPAIPVEGSIASGTVVQVDDNWGEVVVLLDVPCKGDGMIPSSELSLRADIKASTVVQPGQHIEALVVLDMDGWLVLSKKRADYRYQGVIEGKVACGPVVEVADDGLILNVGTPGFLPASLVERGTVTDLQRYAGRVLDANVVGTDSHRNMITLSRQAWLETHSTEDYWDVLSNLMRGQLCRGVVQSMVADPPRLGTPDFRPPDPILPVGAIVDLGGVVGSIPDPEMPAYPHAIGTGDEVDVQLIDVEVWDLERLRRVFFDPKQLQLSLKAIRRRRPQEARHPDVGEAKPRYAILTAAEEVAGLLAAGLDQRLCSFYGSNWLAVVNEQRKRDGYEPSREGLRDERFCLALFAYDKATEGWAHEQWRHLARRLRTLANKAAHNEPLTERDRNEAIDIATSFRGR